MIHAPGLCLIYDYVDPASFLLEVRLRGMERPESFSLEVIPLETSPPPTPLLDPRQGPWAQRWEELEEEGRKEGLAFRRPWIVPWTRKAHELACEAEKRGCFREIHETIFRAYLLEGLDIGRVDVLVDLGRRHGMDPRETKAALDVDVHRDRVLERRREVLQMGVTGTPALIWEGRRMDGYPDRMSLEEFLGLRTDE